MFLTSNLPSLSETILSKSPLNMGINSFFLVGGGVLKFAQISLVRFLTFRRNKCLPGWFWGGKDVSKCPDNTEDVCVCVDQKWFWQSQNGWGDF